MKKDNQINQLLKPFHSLFSIAQASLALPSLLIQFNQRKDANILACNMHFFGNQLTQEAEKEIIRCSINWRNRGYIDYDDCLDHYIKSSKYLAKHAA